MEDGRGRSGALMMAASVSGGVDRRHAGRRVTGGNGIYAAAASFSAPPDTGTISEPLSALPDRPCTLSLRPARILRLRHGNRLPGDRVRRRWQMDDRPDHAPRPTARAFWFACRRTPPTSTAPSSSSG